MAINNVIAREGSNTVVYDASYVSHIEADMFAPGYWDNAQVVPGYSGGRGTTLFVSQNGDDWVVKHYYRGGLVGRFLNDGFFYAGIDAVRSVVEWRILKQAVEKSLPAPAPIAAWFQRRGLVYVAGLITRRIPGARPFSSVIAEQPVAESVWVSVGRCVRRFHDAGFCHADLSAHNLQIDDDGTIWLLDWDRGSVGKSGGWRQANLQRLHRSLKKIVAQDGACYGETDWQALLSGYRKI